jgi:hypothetical protein
MIDAEVNRLVMAGYDKAKELIGRHMDTLKAIAEILLVKETIDSQEVVDLCREAILSEGLEVPKPNAEASFGPKNPDPADSEEDEEDDPNEGQNA